MKRLISAVLALTLALSVFSMPAYAQAASIDPPGKLYSTKLSNSSAKLSWPPVPGAKRYNIYRSKEKDGKYKLIEIYFYKVKAVNKNNVKSAYSDPAKVDLKNMKKNTMNGSFQIVFNKKGFSYNKKNKQYKITGVVCDPVLVKESVAKKLKPGSKFTVKYQLDKNSFVTETFKAYAEDGCWDKEYIAVKTVKAEIYNRKTKKTTHKKRLHRFSALRKDEFFRYGSFYVLINDANETVDNYATARNVTIYINGKEPVMWENDGEKWLFADSYGTKFKKDEGYKDARLGVHVKDWYVNSYDNCRVVG